MNKQTDHSVATPAGLRPRPLSPHLSVYKFIPTMAMSIAHRITGIALYFGILLVAWWLIAVSTSIDAYGTANAVMGSWIGLLVLVGLTWAMWHHLLGGLRHFLWDIGVAMEKRTSTQLAIATLVGSVTLTVLTWIVLFIIVA